MRLPWGANFRLCLTTNSCKKVLNTRHLAYPNCVISPIGGEAYSTAKRLPFWNRLLRIVDDRRTRNSAEVTLYW